MTEAYIFYLTDRSSLNSSPSISKKVQREFPSNRLQSRSCRTACRCCTTSPTVIGWWIILSMWCWLCKITCWSRLCCIIARASRKRRLASLWFISSLWHFSVHRFCRRVCWHYVFPEPCQLRSSPNRCNWLRSFAQKTLRPSVQSHGSSLHFRMQVSVIINFQFISIARNLSYEFCMRLSQQLASIRHSWTPLMKCCWRILLFRLHSHLQFLLLCFIIRNRWRRHQRQTKKLWTNNWKT